MKRLIISFILCGSLYAQDDLFPTLYAKFVLRDGSPRTGEEFTLSFAGKAPLELQHVFIYIDIPLGIELISGETAYENLHFLPGDTVDIPLRLKITEEGPYKIRAYVILSEKDSITESDILFLPQVVATDYYIISHPDTAFCSYEPEEGVYYNLLTDTILGGSLMHQKSINSSQKYKVYGYVYYKDKSDNKIKPLGHVLAILINRSEGRFEDGDFTDDNGYYEIKVKPGKYTLLIEALNVSGQVQPAWEVRAISYFGLPPDIDLHADREPYIFKEQAINLSSDIQINHTAKGAQADWAKILLTIFRNEFWVELRGASKTLEYIEVAYPDTVTIKIKIVKGPWTEEKTIKYNALRTEANGAYFYFPPVNKVQVKLPKDIPLYGGRWWGIGIYYYHPHQIMLREDAVWSPYTITHEWSHGLMVEALGGKIPYDWGHTSHKDCNVFNTGHAFSEGFAEFSERGMWVAEKNISASKYEKFYTNSGRPWYRGCEGDNTNGSKVEGAVRQFFWDLFDDTETNDCQPNWDDEGVYGGFGKIVNTLLALGPLMSESKLVWDTLGEKEDSIRFEVRKWYFPGPSYDFIGKFKEKWEDKGYGYITELYNVDIHPFNYIEPYPLPRPTNLTASYSGGKVHLSWKDNTKNEGYFLLYRKKGEEDFTDDDIIDTIPPNTTSWDDYPEEGGWYRYALKAVTCDTSRLSDEVEVGIHILASYSGFEPDAPPPYEDTPWNSLSQPICGVKHITAKVVTHPDEGVYTLYGAHMYKFKGYDESSDCGLCNMKLYDCNIPITEHTFLSCKFYIKESPEGAGHISLDGICSPWARLRDYFDPAYGKVVDQYGNTIRAFGRSVPEGEWVEYVFNLSPLHGKTLKNLAIAYDDRKTSEQGWFTAYIDELKITRGYPNKYEWYVEVFGGDENAWLKVKKKFELFFKIFV